MVRRQTCPGARENFLVRKHNGQMYRENSPVDRQNCPAFKESFLARRQNGPAFKENFLPVRHNRPVFKENFLAMLGGRIAECSITTCHVVRDKKADLPGVRENSSAGRQKLLGVDRELTCWEVEFQGVKRKLSC